MGNPWNIQSIFELQYFNCPSCIYKDSSKQEIIYHAIDYHPESIEFLANIKDDSLMDVICPWKLIEIKKEEVTDNHEVAIDPLIDPYMVEVNIKMEQTEQCSKIKQNDYVDCGICGKSMKNYYLSTHVKTVHEGRKDHKCSFCGKCYTQKSVLNQHKKTFHKDMISEETEIKEQIEKKTDCDFCGKSFNHTFYLNKHVKTVHEGVKEYKCDLCIKEYSNAQDLKVHVRRVHEGIEDHICNDCGKSFNSARSLKRHIECLHKGIKYKCDYDTCSAEYKEPYDLKIHIEAVHEGKSRHHCDRCGNTFIKSSGLKKHIAIVHEGIKAFKCNLCGKAYGQQNNLSRHIEIVHEGRKDFQCDLCGKEFSYKSHLERHKTNVHKKDSFIQTISVFE